MSVLNGTYVLDFSSLVAAPLAASFLGDFGATVVKIEDTRGDPSRAFLPQRDGIALGYKVTNRNKKHATLNLRDERGRDVLRRLSVKCDVAITNTRPETLAKWKLDYADLCQLRAQDDLVMLHVTGFGRTGPYRERPGFARVAEAFSGLMNITGYSDRAPVPAGYPLADAVTGLCGAYGVMLALYHRLRTGEGQLVDLALYESLFRMIEDLVIEYDQTGRIRERTGTANPVVAPNDIYQCTDGSWFVLPISTQTQFERLCVAMGAEHLAKEERFKTNTSRVKYRADLDPFVTAFISRHDAQELAKVLEAAGVAYAKVPNVAEIVSDPHIQGRKSIVRVFDSQSGSTVAMPAAIPVLTRTPGEVSFAGRPKGADNVEVFQGFLGLSEPEFDELSKEGVI